MNILKKRKWDEAPDSDSNHQRKQEKQKSTHVCIHKIIFPSWSSFRNIMYSADILDTVFSLRDYWVNNSNLSEHKCCSCGNSTLYLKCQVLQQNVMCKYERWYGFMSCDIFPVFFFSFDCFALPLQLNQENVLFSVVISASFQQNEHVFVLERNFWQCQLLGCNKQQRWL